MGTGNGKAFGGLVKLHWAALLLCAAAWSVRASLQDTFIARGRSSVTMTCKPSFPVFAFFMVPTPILQCFDNHVSSVAVCDTLKEL